VGAVTAARTNKVRLVVGLFGNADKLALALADLGARSLTPAQVRVIAQPEVLDSARANWPGEGDARRFATWIACRPAEGAAAWMLSSHDQGHPDQAAEQDAHALLGLHHWALRRQAQQLDHHLRAGGALLVVESHTDAEEWEAGTALLRHASGGVQTHEIARLRRSADDAP
jgi:hypothetical protein